MAEDKNKAFVSNYEYDIFISYGHIDDKNANKWVSDLKNKIENGLKTRLGTRKINIYKDTERLKKHGEFPKHLEKAVKSSFILLLIMSPSYINSDWCKKEREIFLEDTNKFHTQIFMVEPYKVERTEQPEILNKHIGYKFYKEESGRITASYPKIPEPTDIDNTFYQQINELLEDLKEQLTQQKNRAAVYDVDFKSIDDNKGKLYGILKQQKVSKDGKCRKVEVEPETGYYFDKWTWEDGSSKENPFFFGPVIGNRTVTANFKVAEYKVTFTPQETISGEASQTVKHGENCSEVTAKPQAGYHFVKWTWKGGSSTDNPFAFPKVTEKIEVIANFEPNEYEVNFILDSNKGELLGVNPQTVRHGENCSEVTAKPQTGYHFVKWTWEGGSSDKNPFVFNNVKDRTDITANFEPNEYDVLFISDSNKGKITVQSQQKVKHGESCSEVKAEAKVGYHFVNWTWEGGSSTNNPFIFSNVTELIEVIANFELNEYEVSFIINSGKGELSINDSKNKT